MKTCWSCKINKSEIYFCKDKNRKDGLSPQCKNCQNLYKKGYILNHKKEKTEYDKNFYIKNKERILEQNKQWLLDNPEYQKIYNKKRRKIDPEFKTICYLRGRIYKALKNNSKSKRTIELLGCSINDLKSHLESKFIEGMTWENQGEWHIDHIRPCASFDLSHVEDQKKCFHHSNLQPLWAIDNMKKSNKN